jgi:hypothetical protein
MSRLSRTIALIAAVVVGGAVVFLMTWDIPPPTSQVEVVISDDRLPQ